MSMERRGRVLTGGTLVAVLGMILTTSGCRSTRSEVPPGKPYSTVGGPSDLNFNSAPHPNNAVNGGLYSGGMPGAPGQSSVPGPTGLPGMDGSSPGSGSTGALGTPAPATTPIGQPTDNRYGPPTGNPPLGSYTPGR
jgi:hypothetical protein